MTPHSRLLNRYATPQAFSLRAQKNAANLVLDGYQLPQTLRHEVCGDREAYRQERTREHHESAASGPLSLEDRHTSTLHPALTKSSASL